MKNKTVITVTIAFPNIKPIKYMQKRNKANY